MTRIKIGLLVAAALALALTVQETKSASLNSTATVLKKSGTVGSSLLQKTHYVNGRCHDSCINGHRSCYYRTPWGTWSCNNCNLSC
jgi:hypothetical protein